MKYQTALRLLVCVAAVAAIAGAYIKGRRDVLISAFKPYEANMLTLNQWETNHPA
jgi:hypothetical protein